MLCFVYELCRSLFSLHFVCVVATSSCFSSFFFLMIRRPPRSTLDRSSAASDVYKRQGQRTVASRLDQLRRARAIECHHGQAARHRLGGDAVSYTHLRAHETVLDLVCRLLLEKKQNNKPETRSPITPCLTPYIINATEYNTSHKRTAIHNPNHT